MTEVLSFVPGPSHVREEVRRAMATPPIPHRSEEFGALVGRVHGGLALLLGTTAPVFPVLASGTGTLEAALAGIARDRVLVVTAGAFGERLVRIARALGLDVEGLALPPGDVPGPEVFDRALANAGGRFDTVAVVHSETSTGALADLPALAEVVAGRPGVALVVDAVSSLGGVDIEFDRLGAEVVVASVTGKCLACPPGMGILAVTPGAAERARGAERGGFALRLETLLDFHGRSAVPQTPSTALFHALDVQLRRIAVEGMAARERRHRQMAALVQAWAEERFAVLAREGARSPTVTTVENTQALDVDALRRDLLNRGYRIADGYRGLAGATFRIGHMGDLTVEETRGLLAALDDILP